MSSVAELLAAARRGERAALGQLFDSARQQLLDAAARSLPVAIRGRVGPSDIVQEAAIDAHRDFHRFTGTTAEELFAWLRSILNHNLIDAIRHHQTAQKRSPAREVRLDDSRFGRRAHAVSGADRSPDGSAIRKEDAAELHRTLARLPDDYRTVIWLRYWRGLGFEEIAVQMARSPAAVRKLWHRAMRRLNQELAMAADATVGDAPESGQDAPDNSDSGERFETVAT